MDLDLLQNQVCSAVYRMQLVVCLKCLSFIFYKYWHVVQNRLEIRKKNSRFRNAGNQICDFAHFYFSFRRAKWENNAYQAHPATHTHVHTGYWALSLQTTVAGETSDLLLCETGKLKVKFILNFTFFLKYLDLD